MCGSGFSLVTIVAMVLVTLATIRVCTLPPRGRIQRRDMDGHDVYTQAGVATDVEQCSQIGKDMLVEGGSSVDAAIAAMLCVGVHHMHSAGIGGSGVMVVHDRPSGNDEMELKAINFQDAAPLKTAQDIDESQIAVFGEIAGYYMAWERYGALPWEELFHPAIHMCVEGFTIGPALGQALANKTLQDMAKRDKGNMRDIFFKADGHPYHTGDVMRLPELANTLQRIAQAGDNVVREFYRGSLADDVLQDLKDLGSAIRLEDLSQYEARLEDAMVMPLSNANVKLATPGAPAGGPVLQFAMQLIDGMEWSDSNEGLNYHRLAEIFKYAFAFKTKLGDPNYVNIAQELEDIKNATYIEHIISRINGEPHTFPISHYAPGPGMSTDTGGAHVSVMTTGGETIAITSSINAVVLKWGRYSSRTFPISHYEPGPGLSTDAGGAHVSVMTAGGETTAISSSINAVFGSFKRGKRTGIIFNNGMASFADTNRRVTSTNSIAPGKRPLSSMSPTLVLNGQGQPLVAIGAAGGPMITTSLANVLLQNLYLDKDLKESISAPRVHHQLMPDILALEEPLFDTFKSVMKARGHVVELRENLGVVNGVLRSCDAIDLLNCTLMANGDNGRNGEN